jgi:hypothetical protein
MNKQLLASLFRHLLTASGGVGLFSDSELETLAGAAMILIGLLWSYLEKRENSPEKLLQTALTELQTQQAGKFPRPVKKWGKRDR